MPIVSMSNGTINRQMVCSYLEKKKAANPNYKVIDIGGSANNWCDKYVDAYVDFIPSSNKRTFIGDINLETVWADIYKENWDFCICTHLLEDIRTPDFVIRKIQECFSAGFISMPNKHSELSHVESRFFLGWSHHRWIFTIVDNELKAIAKMPIVHYFSPRNSWYHLICANQFMKRIFKHFKFFVPAFDGRLKWVNPELVGGNYELAFIWERDFEFSYINNDFAGTNTAELACLYLDELVNGI